MKNIVTIAFILFSISKLNAQPDEWYQGVVVLSTQEVVTGEIAVGLRQNVIFIKKENGGVAVLPAHQIASALYYDSADNINRKFLSVHSVSRAWKTSVLYEQVVRGDIAVIRDEKMYAAKIKSDADDYEYFVYDGEDIYPLAKFKSTVYHQLMKGANANQLAEKVSEYHLNPTRLADAIQIIECYNALVKTDETLARF